MSLFIKSILILSIVHLSGCSYLANYEANQAINELSQIGGGKFSSQEEFVAYFKKTAAVRSHINRQRKQNSGYPNGVGTCLEEIVVTAQKATANPVITNNQEAGVDEGDIVKVIGDYFVILRQGKLYAVRMASDSHALTPTDSINVIKPGWEHQAWIDELLVYQNYLVVIGYAYQGVLSEGTTEFNILQLSDDGTFKHINTYVIRSADYFSSENYATRIIDGELVFNFPVPLYEMPVEREQAQLEFAQIGRLPDTPEQKITWSSLLVVEDIYKPVETTLFPALHVFVKCELRTELDNCQSAGVISSQFEIPSYVTTKSIYFAAQSLRPEYLIDAEFDYSIEGNFNYSDFHLYRIDLKDFAVNDIGIKGMPLNQFSFQETVNGLNLVTGWELESADIEFYLQKIEKEDFKSPDHEQVNTTLIGEFDGDNYYTTRFTNIWLAIGEIYNYWQKPPKTTFNVQLVSTIDDVRFEIPLSHTADRLELTDNALLVMGYREEGTELTASLITDTDSPSVQSSYDFTGIYEGEARSHGFNFTHYPSGERIFGFTSQWKEGRSKNNAYLDYQESPSDIVFMHIDESLQMQQLTTFESMQKPEKQTYDCDVSCYDWYGNTRPFFLGGKVYGLTGYELIQGVFKDGQVTEEYRVDYRKNIESLAHP
ncbi:MAG: beta-propeller domain-containing protein [Cellvibrionaceae bacterium]